MPPKKVSQSCANAGYAEAEQSNESYPDYNDEYIKMHCDLSSNLRQTKRFRKHYMSRSAHELAQT